MDILENVPLSRYTTFKIGGPAKFFVQARTLDELKKALIFAQSKKVNFFILGGGSNLLVSDQGFGGLVVKLQLNECKVLFKKNVIQAEAGAPLSLLVNLAAQKGLMGLEWATGIPGTVGGAIRGNAGAFGGQTGLVVKQVRVFDLLDLREKTLSQAECRFDYRFSVFKEEPEKIILEADFGLFYGKKEVIREKMRKILKQRTACHPRNSSAGSFFLNPVVENEKLRKEFERDTGEKLEGKRLPAGWLIDQLDLRGKKVGKAMVAEEHANWIVNTGGASAQDVIMLASIIKQKVRDEFGIELREEVEFLGF